MKRKRKRKVVSCQRKKKETKSFCIPEDIIFEILIKLPAQFLHVHGRNVCKPWADLVNSPIFMKSHHTQSNKVLLLQYNVPNGLKSLEVNKRKPVLKDETMDFSGRVMSSCSGITLFCLSEKNFSFCVANIVTKQMIELPFVPLDWRKQMDYRERMSAAIGYDYLRGEFKVICFSTAKDVAYWLFFTLGKDKAWRKVDIVSSNSSIESLDRRRWISAGGVTYGYGVCHEHFGNIVAVNVGGVTYGVCREHFADIIDIIAVDVGDEIIWRVNVPDDKEETIGGFLEEKNQLMCITHGQKEPTTSVYRLDDYRQSSWVKINKFELHPSAHNLIKISRSLVWVENGELLVFQLYPSVVIGAYNVRTGSCKLLRSLPWPIKVHVISKNPISL